MAGALVDLPVNQAESLRPPVWDIAFDPRESGEVAANAPLAEELAPHPPVRQVIDDGLCRLQCIRVDLLHGREVGRNVQCEGELIPGWSLFLQSRGAASITPRRDTDHELYVVVLSNAVHLAADTGRVITCPYIPGQAPDAAMAMVVAVNHPDGAVLPELVQWLPTVALDEPIGNVGAAALQETTTLLTALVS